MQRSPSLIIGPINVGTVLHQKLDHVQVVVNARLEINALELIAISTLDGHKQIDRNEYQRQNEGILNQH